VLLLVALATCAAHCVDPASTPPPSQVFPTPDPGATLVRGVCLDPTGSSPASFSDRVQARLAERVQAWAPVEETPAPMRSSAHPGLSLVVRVVATDSPSSNDGYGMIIDIPAVPELPPPPDVQAANFVDLQQQYVAQQARVKAKRAEAAREALAAAQQLRTFRLDHEHQRSGVTACASVLAVMAADVARSSSNAGDRSFLIASDLDDNVSKQLNGSFEGATVLLLQPCPGGDMARCAQLASTFAEGMKKLHAGTVNLIRSELADRTIDAWLEPAR
jgi:hypothetical protein